MILGPNNRFNFHGPSCSLFPFFPPLACPMTTQIVLKTHTPVHCPPVAQIHHSHTHTAYCTMRTCPIAQHRKMTTTLPSKPCPFSCFFFFSLSLIFISNCRLNNNPPRVKNRLIFCRHPGRTRLYSSTSIGLAV